MTSSNVKSAYRVFEILEFFREARGPVRLKAITSKLAYPASSTAALLKTLTDLGYLTYERTSRTYLPTYRVTELGDWIPPLLDQGAVSELMQRLHARTGELIMLATYNDIYLQYLRVIRSHHTFQVYVEAGTKRPLVRAGLGWVLLSAYDDEMIRTIYAHSVYRKEIRRRDWTLETTMREVRLVRRRGYSVSHGTVQSGASVIGMLIPKTPHGPTMCIGISGPTTRVKDRTLEIAEIIREELDHRYGVHDAQPRGGGAGRQRPRRRASLS